MINRICTFYFSGTDTTKKVVTKLSKIVAEKLGVEEIYNYNFTTPKMREINPEFKKGDLVISAVPTIAGRVPNLLLPYLQNIQAQGAIAVPIAMYGNRNYDDCLIELRDLLKQSGMKIIAAGAFIGEHSFSEILAKNRPDEKDFKILEEFGEKICKKIKNNNLEEPKIKGEEPYRFYFTPRDRHGNGINFVKIKPNTNLNLCIDCKKCARECPLGSINFEKVWEIPGKCMKCCACIKKCPTKAKYFDDEGYIYHMHELEEMYIDRKEPEYFI